MYDCPTLIHSILTRPTGVETFGRLSFSTKPTPSFFFFLFPSKPVHTQKPTQMKKNTKNSFNQSKSTMVKVSKGKKTIKSTRTTKQHHKKTTNNKRSASPSDKSFTSINKTQVTNFQDQLSLIKANDLPSSSPLSDISKLKVPSSFNFETNGFAVKETALPIAKFQQQLLKIVKKSIKSRFGSLKKS